MTDKLTTRLSAAANAAKRVQQSIKQASQDLAAQREQEQKSNGTPQKN